jgi:hypothetical protein
MQQKRKRRKRRRKRKRTQLVVVQLEVGAGRAVAPARRALQRVVPAREAGPKQPQQTKKRKRKKGERDKQRAAPPCHCAPEKADAPHHHQCYYSCLRQR